MHREFYDTCNFPSYNLPPNNKFENHLLNFFVYLATYLLN